MPGSAGWAEEMGWEWLLCAWHRSYLWLTDAVQRFRAGESVNAAAVSLKLQQHLSVQLCSGDS